MKVPEASRKRCVGILAGSGPLPAQVAAAVRARGDDVFVVAFRDFAELPRLAPYPHEVFRLAAAGEILSALKRHGCRELVLIGPVRRPAWRDLRPDGEGARILARLGRAIFLGDDGLLGAVVRVLGEEGFFVRGAHEFLQHATGHSGSQGRVAPDVQARADIARGVAVLRTMARLDIGQGCVVQNGLVLAVEALEGTDAMLGRCGPLMQAGSGGVLVKMPKQGQDLRADMPTIGPETLENAARNGLRGVAFQPGVTLLTDPTRCVAQADRYGLFLYGLTTDDLKE
ncbi:LpxI family protein [Neokomagataea tanensis]|uniref:LpxI family protein n=1 Tax=Neokomagataea tanensis TaxID=661191 RepID=A0A4Y6VBX3_9PROT|nr:MULTISPECIES: UDP-2,3-diacylglucosamine diphosphatase LpxI [Neokomagataea]QDH25885.1 LpxI family protein [Neokomagataea tanensis]